MVKNNVNTRVSNYECMQNYILWIAQKNVLQYDIYSNRGEYC